jgi:serine protease Do
MRSLGFRSGAVALFLVVACIGSSVSVVAAAKNQRLPDFASLVKRSAPAVVNISTTQKRAEAPPASKRITPPKLPENSPFNEYFQRYFDKSQAPEKQPDAQSLGSGFIISADGYIISNFHVVKNADEVIVRLNDRREFVASLVGADKRSDIALLKIDATGLPVATLGHSDRLSVGEWVLAIGSPFGLEYSVTVGIVSYKGRPLPQANYVPYIQTDVAINPGNSGGPLFNQAGEVVGVNSQIFSRTGGYMGMSFAIPIDVAMNVVDQLRTKGHVSRGWLGVLIHDVTGEMAEAYGLTRPEGARIARVLEDSPAAHGQMQAGDVVLSYDGHPVFRSSDLPPIVGASPIGETAPVVVIRKVGEAYERLVLKVKTGELPEQLSAAAKPLPPKAEDYPLGAELADLSEADRRSLSVAGQWGVRVLALEPGPLLSAGVQKGDVILSLNRIDVESVKQFADISGNLPEDRALALYIQRGKIALFLSLRVAAK